MQQLTKVIIVKSNFVINNNEGMYTAPHIFFHLVCSDTNDRLKWVLASFRCKPNFYEVRKMSPLIGIKHCLAKFSMGL